MAKTLADSFFTLGASVRLLSSVPFENLPYECELFENADELENLMKKHQNGDFLLMCAAVSDFGAEFYAGKLKKSDFEKGLTLHLNPKKDLLKNCEFKGKKIGFKLEFDAQNAVQNAKNALKEKALDMICLNVISKDNAAFGSDFNALTLITQDDISELSRKSKGELALEIARWCKRL